MNINLTPDVWTQQFYHQWFTILYDKWKYRNDKLHGKNSTFHCEQLLKRIYGYYKWQNVLPLQDQHCFVRPLGEWGTQSIQVMNRWLEIHGSYIQNSVQQTRELQKIQVRDVRQWCTSTTKHPPTPIPPTNSHKLNPPRLSIKSPIRYRIILVANLRESLVLTKRNLVIRSLEYALARLRNTYKLFSR